MRFIETLESMVREGKKFVDNEGCIYYYDPACNKFFYCNSYLQPLGEAVVSSMIRNMNHLDFSYYVESHDWNWAHDQMKQGNVVVALNKANNILYKMDKEGVLMYCIPPSCLWQTSVNKYNDFVSKRFRKEGDQ